MFFFQNLTFTLSVSYFSPKQSPFSHYFLNFYEVFLNMGLSGCQKSNFHGEDLIVFFETYQILSIKPYFFSPGPPWDPRGDPTCDKISSISKIWPVFLFFHVFCPPRGVFFMFFLRPGMFFSCVSRPGMFFMFFIRIIL